MPAPLICPHTGRDRYSLLQLSMCVAGYLASYMYIPKLYMCVPKLFVLQVCTGLLILAFIALFAIQDIEDFIYNHQSFRVAAWSLPVLVIAMFLHPIIYTLCLDSKWATKHYVPYSVIVSQHCYECITI